MNQERKKQLELAALERELNGAEEVLNKGYLKFIAPRVLIFTAMFTPLIALIQIYGESRSTTLSDWLWFLVAGLVTGWLGSSVEFFMWRRIKSRNSKLLEEKKGLGAGKR